MYIVKFSHKINALKQCNLSKKANCKVLWSARKYAYNYNIQTHACTHACTHAHTHIYYMYLHWEIFCFSISTSCSFSKTFSSVSFKASWLLRLANSASFEDVPLLLALILGPMLAFTLPVFQLEELVADHDALYGVEDVPSRTRQDKQFMQFWIIKSKLLIQKY